MKSVPCAILTLLLTCSPTVTRAQQVSIPDAGLTAAIRDALRKPTGPLSQQDLLNLTNLDASNRGVGSIAGLDAARNLAVLNLSDNNLTNVTLPSALTNLTALFLGKNPVTNLVLPVGLNRLTQLDVSGNALASLVVPADLVKLSVLNLAGNQLASFTLPVGLTNLSVLDLDENQLTGLTLPAGLVNLGELDLFGNELVSFTLPPDITKLVTLTLDANPLRTLVLSDVLAATNLTATVNALRNQEVFVSTFPLATQLTSPGVFAGAFQFVLVGPPGVYTVQSSTDLSAFSNLSAVTNLLGFARFDDPAPLVSKKFFRALLQGIPSNMVFIPSNTFTMGSPTNETGRSADEGPQTIVTLSHGFWISKFPVTQQDYLNVIHTNPSAFVGDLSRPVESVTWLDATNYCAQLTLQDLAASRIPTGTHYRLPTEAEWECAARAGTSTRYYYGDDPGAASLSSHAWFGAINGATTHPVGQKPPNAFGLFDMEGNVWEWSQDWYGPYSGGTATDPQGPASNQSGVKVIRGGAWESFDSDCRSARRMTEAVSPFIKDFIIGFRVVLVTDP